MSIKHFGFLNINGKISKTLKIKQGSNIKKYYLELQEWYFYCGSWFKYIHISINLKQKNNLKWRFVLFWSVINVLNIN